MFEINSWLISEGQLIFAIVIGRFL